MTFHELATIAVDPQVAIVYEHGWHSWSPTGVHRASERSARPDSVKSQRMGFRADSPPGESGFQGEGLLAIQPEPDAPVTIWWAPNPRREVPSIRASLRGRELVVAADGEVRTSSYPAPLGAALESFGDELARHLELGPTRELGTGWCSWYCYWLDVTENDVLENLAAIDRYELQVDTVQLDDGYEAGIGDWLERRTDRFPSPLRDLAQRIVDTGRTAGIWTAPFLVGADSGLARDHPDWLVGGADAGSPHWEQDIAVLDVTHPGAAEHLVHTFRTLRDWGFSYHKIDFLYAGAMAGRRHADIGAIEAYVEGLRLVREGIGDDAVLLGCGAPILPSIGHVDAMRISPDIALDFDPPGANDDAPAGRNALRNGRARAWQHGRLWVNDPDCLIVRPEVERRDVWAGHVRALGGLAVSSDPIGELDDVGMVWTRELLRAPRPHAPRWRADPDDRVGGGPLEGETGGGSGVGPPDGEVG